MTEATAKELRERVSVLELVNATLRGDVAQLEEALRRAERELGELRQHTEYAPSNYPAGWGGD